MSAEKIDQDFEIALGLHQAGRLLEAQAIYQRILLEDTTHPGALYLSGVIAYQQGRYDAAADFVGKALLEEPADPEALHLLGTIFYMQGKYDAAIASINKALSYRPNYVEAYYNLGNALMMAGNLDEAIVNYRRALALQPNYADAQVALGGLLQRQGKLDEAIESYRKAILLRPDSVEAHNNLGNALQAQGKLDEAVACYRQALTLKPDYADAYNNLGNVLQAQGKLDDAIASYRQALSVKSNYAEAHNNLGNVLQQQEQFEAAIASYRQALAIKSDYAEAHNNLGNALQAQGKFDDAVSAYRQAVAVKPDYAEAHYNLGKVFQTQYKLDLAIASYRQALAVKPDYALAHNNLGAVLEAQFKYAEAIVCFRQAVALNPDYVEALGNLANTLTARGDYAEAVVNYRRALALNPNYAALHSNYLMASQYIPGYTPAQILADHTAFADHFEAPLRGNWSPQFKRGHRPQRLKVGFVSGDLCAHPVGFFFDNVLSALDRNVLDVTLYPTWDRADDLTARLKSMASAFHPLTRLSDEKAFDLIRADDIDILVDLSGHTGHNRLPLFARKPAPIQVAWLGYWATTGLRAIDYILCDRYGIPAEEINHFVEKPWYLPDTRLCFTPPRIDLPVSTLPALSNGCVTFGCFNNLTKMNDAVVSQWAKVLSAVAGSRLFLKAKQLGDASLREQTRARFAAHGIDGERLLLEGHSSYIDYLEAYRRIDIVLDPFPFPGGTTSIEALWMGVPIITRKGDRLIAHQGEAILHNVKLPEWIADDEADYVAKVVARTTNLQQLAELRAQLRARLLSSPLCDAPRLARNLEKAFHEMWQEYCAQV